MIKTRIKHKRDTAANWTAENTILLNGEIAIVDDGNSTKLKIGDGSTAYNSLPFYVSAADLNNATGVIPIANGGTGATSAADALSNLGAAPSSHSHSSLNVYASNESNIANGHIGGILHINYRGVNGAITDYAFCDGKGNTLATLSGLKQDNGYHTGNATSIGGASATKPAVVVTSYRSGASWYRVWSDGWIEQGGTSTFSSTTCVVTFHKAFADTNYMFCYSKVRYASKQGVQVHYNRTTTKVDCIASIDADCPFYWYACGR